MSDVQMPESIPCQFDAKGWRPCKKPSNNGWCSEHEHAMCASCGQHAVQLCDAQMGAFGCGANLCATCGHVQGGDHVTQEVLEQRRQAAFTEEELRVASRSSPVRRMHPELGVPLNLFELLKSDPKEIGFELTKVYFLQLNHGLMGVHPIIFSEDEKRVVLTTDLRILETVWESVEPRRSTIRSVTAYVNHALGIAYIDAQSQAEREESTPDRLLTDGELKTLFESDKGKPFRWASGVWGDFSLPRDVYLQWLAMKAKEIDPSFVSSYAPLTRSAV